MNIREIAFADVAQEFETTRKILERVPANFSWQPHEKSGKLGALAQHVATLPRMFERVANTEEVDVLKFQRPPQVDTAEEVLKMFDENVALALQALAGLSEADFEKIWTFRMGERIIFQLPRYRALRTFAISHIVHHRAQLGVYLRLLDVPIPGSYGPSADEPI